MAATRFLTGTLLLALMACACAQNWTADDARAMVSDGWLGHHRSCLGASCLSG
jgi:hypothetical protein